MLRRKSVENIRLKKFDNLMSKDLPLPKIKNVNQHQRINFADNYMKLILLKNFPDPLSSINTKDFILRKHSYMKRHGGANKLKENIKMINNKLFFTNFEKEFGNEEEEQIQKILEIL